MIGYSNTVLWIPKLGNNAEDYIRLITKEIEEDTPEKHVKRSEYAQSLSWEKNISEVFKAIEKFDQDSSHS